MGGSQGLQLQLAITLTLTGKIVLVFLMSYKIRNLTLTDVRHLIL